MNRFPDNPGERTPFRPLALIIGFILLLSGLPAAATQPDNADQKIRITADRLVTDTKTGIAEFIGNVRAAQGATVITSHRLKILYEQSDVKSTTGQSETSIKTIISTGNVVIHFDDKVARTDKAAYNSQTGIFTLTGKDTRITSGENTITGEKITVDRNNDRMTVESGRDSRVNAVIFTQQGGLAPQLQKTGTTGDGK